MILLHQNENSVELSIDGYQYPSKDEGLYDCNWLNIRLRAKDKDREWQKKDPSLLSWEFAQIAEWFATLAKGNEPKDKLISFIEPCLAYEYQRQGDAIEISFLFTCEMAPPDADRSCPYSIRFLLNGSELTELSRQFAEEAKRFPPRGDQY